VAARKAKAKPKRVKARAKRTPRPAKRKAASRKTAPKRKTAVPRWQSDAPYQSLAELRGAIDGIDETIIPLLCRRLGLVRQAAQFKPSHAGVVVQARVDEIVARVRDEAGRLGCNPDTLEGVYRCIIDEFTLEEQRNWLRLNVREA
jgi:isochorismate pyruvate lyase